MLSRSFAVPHHSARRVMPAASLAVLCATLLAACGGGGGTTVAGSTGTPASAVPAVNSAVIYSGPVSGLGSIVVNGVRFETVGSKVHDSDDPYGASSYSDPIKLGMTVSVEGAADDAKGTGTASTIRVDGGIRGQVTAVDATANTLTVNGQTITSSPTTTVFQGATGLAGIATSSWVEVYGLARSDGTFLATRIEAYGSRDALTSSYRNAADYPVSLRGIVLGASANSFTLSNGAGGTITVNYRAGDVVPSGATIAVGSSVRVAAASITANIPVSATRVRVLDASGLAASSGASPAADGTSMKIKGVVDSVAGDTIVVSGTTVNVAGASRAGTPVKGQVVEVSGTLRNGTVVASKLEFEDRETTYTSTPGAIATALTYRQELYGIVSGYSSASSTFVVQGVTVKVGGSTRYEQGYSKLADNTYVEVKGTLKDGVLLAAKLDVKGATATGSRADIPSTETRSSGGESFEVYGTLTCTAYPTTCSVAATGGNTLKANLATATWSAEHGGYVAGAALPVEAKGSLDSAGVFQVVKIERKS